MDKIDIDKNFTASDIDISSCYKIGDDIYAVSSLGACPVEYSGVVSEYCFYFKSRGQVWKFKIADSMDNCLLGTDSNTVFSCFGKYDNNEFSAGYMLVEQAENIIRSCVALWRLGQITD